MSLTRKTAQIGNQHIEVPKTKPPDFKRDVVRYLCFDFSLPSADNRMFPGPLDSQLRGSKAVQDGVRGAGVYREAQGSGVPLDV